MSPSPTGFFVLNYKEQTWRFHASTALAPYTDSIIVQLRKLKVNIGNRSENRTCSSQSVAILICPENWNPWDKSDQIHQVILTKDCSWALQKNAANNSFMWSESLLCFCYLHDISWTNPLSWWPKKHQASWLLSSGMVWLRDHSDRLWDHLSGQGCESPFWGGLWFPGIPKDSKTWLSKKYKDSTRIILLEHGQYLFKMIFDLVGFASVFKVFKHIQNYSNIFSSIVFCGFIQNAWRRQLFLVQRSENKTKKRHMCVVVSGILEILDFWKVQICKIIYFKISLQFLVCFGGFWW